MVLQLKKREIRFLMEMLRLRMFEITRNCDERFRDDEKMSWQIYTKLESTLPKT